MAANGGMKRVFFAPQAGATSQARLDSIFNRIALVLLPLSVLLIIHLTLEPYNFALPQGAAADPGALLKAFWNGVSDADDILNNYVFFMPLGLSLACLLEKTRWSAVAQLLVILIVGGSLSLAVELTQLFLPDRTSTRIDVFSNSVGSLLGGGIWHGTRIWTRSHANLALGLALYIPLAIGALIAVPSWTTLSVWSPNYSLLIGNERTGDRPWRGTVESLQIANRALAAPFGDNDNPGAEFAETLVADYVWSPDGTFEDRSGNLPPILPQPLSTDSTEPPWFMTEASVAELQAQIAATSEFTIRTRIAAADSDQTGPARIISFSTSPSLRNFTLGQDGSDLVFRLRTPVTGPNGVWPQVLVPNVFADTQPHDLLLSYAGGKLEVYVDGVLRSSSFQLSREWALISFLIPPELFALASDWLPMLSVQITAVPQLICYMLIYVPAGLLLATLGARWAEPRRRTLLAVAGAVGVVVGSQGALWLFGGQAPLLLSGALGLLLTLSAYWFFSRRSPGTSR